MSRIPHPGKSGEKASAPQKRQSVGSRSKKVVEAASKELDDETKIERMAFNAHYYERLQNAMAKIEAYEVLVNIKIADALPINRVLGGGTTAEGYQDGQCDAVYMSACSIYTHACVEEVKP